MCANLEEKGAKVFFVTDCDLDEFKKVESEYTEWLVDHPNALGLLFYAGHAVEFRNHNWLLMKSAKQSSPDKDSVCMTKFIARYVYRHVVRSELSVSQSKLCACVFVEG